MGISYSVDTSDAAAVAMVRERPMSFKDSVEVCRHAKGMPVRDAIDALERVIDGEEPVPMKQHNSDVGHRSDLEGWDAGRFPEKATQGIVDALENAVANAEHQGHDPDELTVDHLAAHKVGESEGMMSRAMGRATPANTPLVDVEVVLSPPETTREPDEDETHTGWVRGVFEALAPHATGGVYLNATSPDEGQAGVRDAFGTETYERLAMVKAEWDPENVFHLTPNVRPGV